ncbi:MAG: hypothetical protein ABJD11_08785 [Gemmatimonadota bacterium]
MAKPTARSENTLDKLLQDRSQYVTWLARLDSTSDAVPAVPESVRTRIRADYETRLHAVLDELRSHTEGLKEQLEEFSARRAELALRETQAKETMAEAEVRHAVGEFDEGRWQSIRGETARMLVSVREELGRTSSEIDRLTEVLTLIETPAEAPAQPEPVAVPQPVAEAPRRPSGGFEAPHLAHHQPPAPAPVPVPVPEVVHPAATGPVIYEEPEADPEPEIILATPDIPVGPTPPLSNTPSKPLISGRVPARPAPKRDDATPAKTLWFPSGKSADTAEGSKIDELAFLKSVGSEAAAPKRASGGFTKPAEPAPVSTPMINSGEPFAKQQPMPGAATEHKEKPSQPTAAKTLKCGECGTMNRPTEWYCERCGAELAAL